MGKWFNGWFKGVSGLLVKVIVGVVGVVGVSGEVGDSVVGSTTRSFPTLAVCIFSGAIDLGILLNYLYTR